MAPVVAGHPDLDETLVVRLRRPSLGGLRSFLEALDRFAPDVVLDLMGNHKAGAIAALALADRRIGAAWRSRREPSSAVWINRPVAPQGSHSVDRMLSLLAGLGLPREPADFAPAKLFREEPAASLDLAEREGPYLLLHPGAAWANKIYPPVWWGRVAQRLGSATGLPTWIAEARGERELAEEVLAASGTAARLVAAPDLPSLAALIRRARLFLGGDTGPTHLAHALGTPVLMVMGPTDPERNGPYGAPELALFRRLPCSFCHRRFAETKACLWNIPPEEVAARALALLH
jgi:heptosyltransferase-1